MEGRQVNIPITIADSEEMKRTQQLDIYLFYSPGLPSNDSLRSWDARDGTSHTRPKRSDFPVDCNKLDISRSEVTGLPTKMFHLALQCYKTNIRTFSSSIGFNANRKLTSQ